MKGGFSILGYGLDKIPRHFLGASKSQVSKEPHIGNRI
jgi:hypothetical protein